MYNRNPIVSVMIITYNHEKYIAQAIESALMQKTNFDYEIVIGEDCSTDKTRDIVIEYAKKYPEKIKPILNEENLGAIANLVKTLKHCKGKYVALLEGDDYRTDPYKLQKQVDFLESNPDYGLVHSDCDFYFQNASKLIKNINKINRYKICKGYIFEDLLIGNRIKTLTVCFRKELLFKNNFIDELRIKNWAMGDYPLWLEISRYSKIHYIDESTAVHIIHNSSVTAFRNIRDEFAFYLSLFSVKKYFIEKHGCLNETKKAIFAKHYNSLINFGWKLKNIHIAIEGIEYFKKEGYISPKNILLFYGSKYEHLNLLIRIIALFRNFWKQYFKFSLKPVFHITWFVKDRS